MKYRKLLTLTLSLLLLLSACSSGGTKTADMGFDEATTKVLDQKVPTDSGTEEKSMATMPIVPNVSSTLIPPDNSPFPNNPNLGVEFDTTKLKDIYLAGGCFWGVEAYMSRVYGVYDVTSGYANGNTENPTYQDVIAGSGHTETVHVQYDPNRVDIDTLLTYFFEVVDPTSLNKQGNDRGINYRSGIYYTNETDLPMINAFMAQLEEKYVKPIVVEVEPLDGYYLAEEYHQDYLEKNPGGYCHIEFDALYDQEVPMTKDEYNKPDDTTLKENLTDLQYAVTQEGATERAFANEYWDNHDPGIYVDVVTGEPLFSSTAKYDSGSGWPAFYATIDEEALEFNRDTTLGMERVEVKSANGDSHLGHVFNDGPAEYGGVRYCINSASLLFIPYEEMEEKGYGEYMYLIEVN